MSSTLTLTILTPERTLLHVDAIGKVRLRLADGGFLSVYPRHAPLIAETAPCVLQYNTTEGENEITIGSGLLQVLPDRVLILASQLASADLPMDVDDDGEPAKFERLARELTEALEPRSQRPMSIRAISDDFEEA